MTSEFKLPRLITICLLSFFFIDCKNDKAKQSTPIFCVSDSLAKIIEFDTVRTRPLFKEVRLTGRVSYDEDKVVRVFPPVSGIVQDVTVSLGDYVQPGQVLAKIKSSDMAAYNSQYSTDLANQSISKRTMDFTEELYKSGAASEKDFSVARDNYNIAVAEVARIKQVLKIFGEEGKDLYYVRSPISGFVVEKKITEGMILRQDASDNALTISDLRDVWVLGNAFEQDLEGIEIGDPVQVKTLAYDRVYKGRVAKISRMIDPLTKANKVRVVLSNNDFKLQPEMYATVVVHTPLERDLPSIKSDAAIFHEDHYFVVGYKEKCKLEVIPINPHSTVSGIMYLDSTLPEGMIIISKYQLLIFSKLNNAN